MDKIQLLWEQSTKAFMAAEDEYQLKKMTDAEWTTAQMSKSGKETEMIEN